MLQLADVLICAMNEAVTLCSTPIKRLQNGLWDLKMQFGTVKLTVPASACVSSRSVITDSRQANSLSQAACLVAANDTREIERKR